MILDKTINKRLGVYFFYDKDGIVDKYIDYFLDDFSKQVQRLIIVINGELSEEGNILFRKYTKDVIVRENSGLDVWAYKTAFDYCGWDELETYDEVVITNFTIMGPVYSMKDVFGEMAQKDLDFWGITKYFKFEHTNLERIPYGYIPEHIQSYFMVYRSNLVSSKAFQDYWNQMPAVNSYHDSIGYFEAIFTKKFADLGYKWDTYVKMDDMQSLTWYAMLDYPLELIRDKKCPFFKRRSFFEDYSTVHNATLGEPCSRLYDYLKKSGLYDVDLIWENILRTCHQSDIAKNLHLNYILPINYENYIEKTKRFSNKKIALFMHLYFMDLLESSFVYASSMPNFADVYVTTDTEQKKEQIEKKFSELQCNKLTVVVVKNRGRDVSALLVGLKGVPQQYEYACFFHDKKAGQENPGSIGESFGYKCSENILYSKEYVCQIIELFENNPRLGILSAPEPNHGPYFPTLGDEWHDNFDITKDLADRLGLHVPMAADKEPIAPLGSVFWFRTDALRKLHNYSWRYEDFPPEPLAVDHTISHAIERVRPFVAQDAGYYPAFVMNSEYARLEYWNLHQYVRNYNTMLLRNDQLEGRQGNIIKNIDDICSGKYELSQIPLYMKFAAVIERLLPKNVYDLLISIKRRIFGPRNLV